MNCNFRSSTALVLSLTLAAGPGWSQSDGTAACDLNDPVLPCSVDGTLIETQDALLNALGTPEVTADLEADLAAEAAALAEAEALAAEAAAQAEAAATAEAQAAADAAAIAEADAAVAQAEADAAAEQAAAEQAATAEAAAAAEAEAMAAQAAAEAEAVAAEATAEAEAMAAEAALAAELEAAAEEEAKVAQAEAEALAEQAEAQAIAEAEAAKAAEAEAEAMIEAEAAEVAEAEAAAEIEAEAEAEAEMEAEVAADVEAEAETKEDVVAQEEPAAEEANGEATLAPEGEEPVAPTMEETVEEAPVTAAASAEGEGEAEVTTEEVVEGDVRTADEDFETAVTGDAAAVVSNNDRGLSNFEKALLLGLGAVAIGSILDNGDEVVSNSGDRIVLQNPDGQFRVLKNDDVLLRQPGSQVETQQFNDGSTRTVVTRQDGTQVITIRAADGRVLRRALVQLDGTQVELFDDTRAETAVDVSTLPRQTALVPRSTTTATEDDLRRALAAELGVELNRTFSLRQVRNIREVRDLAPVVELDTITFRSGSAAIQPDQARELAILGQAINSVIVQQPGAVFLVEGHTDAVGNAGYNLALSDRRAETVALALTEYFDVPAVNLITQGYGESQLKVRTLADEQANRRAVVRNVTRLLQ